VSRGRASLAAVLLACAGAAFAQGETKEGAEAAPAAPAAAPAESAPAAAPLTVPDPRRIERVTLPDGRTVVITEGEFEPRSVGSYALRVYLAGDPAFPFDRFSLGMVQPRDGAIERVLVQDLDRDGRPEVVVVLRSAGSGGYLSADAWSFGDRRIVRRASVSGLPPNADPAAALAPRVRRATAP
jgi:hypothetical protein